MASAALQRARGYAARFERIVRSRVRIEHGATLGLQMVARRLRLMDGAGTRMASAALQRARGYAARFERIVRSRVRIEHGATLGLQMVARRLRLMDGAGTRIRTRDPLITNQVLYQLSYAGFSETSKPDSIRGGRIRLRPRRGGCGRRAGRAFPRYFRNRGRCGRRGRSRSCLQPPVRPGPGRPKPEGRWPSAAPR